MTVSSFVAAFKHLKSNSPLSVLYMTGIPSWQSWKASVTMAENTVLKSVGARTQSCFTRSLLESILTRLRHVQNFNHHAFVKLSYGNYEFAGTAKLNSPLSSTSLLCLPYRKPWSGQQRSQKGRYSGLDIFHLQSWWKQVCRIAGEA